MSNKGTFVISFDTELGWGSIQSGLWKYRENKGYYRLTRNAVKKILDIFDQFELPATWAFVGKMLDECQAELDYLPENIKLKIKNALNNSEPDTFYGIDLLEDVLSRKVNHEIGSHSYSHILFQEGKIEEDIIATELRHMRKIEKKLGLNVNSFIFPQNIEGFYDLLVKQNYHICRSTIQEKSLFNKKFILLAKINKIIKFLFLSPPMSNYSKHISGIKRFTGSMFFNPGVRREKYIWQYEKRAIRGIKKACATGGCFHLWVHPFNFSETPSLIDSFYHVIEVAFNEQIKGNLSVLTFSQYANQFS